MYCYVLNIIIMRYIISIYLVLSRIYAIYCFGDDVGNDEIMPLHRL
jgi:hypothetical protein